MEMINWDFLGLFIMMAGFVVGLGAVTVIDLHGFLGRKSPYWNEATIRTHKVTKPLIWLGIFLVVVGGSMFYQESTLEKMALIPGLSVPLMIINGIFLSFSVSPMLIQREKEGRAQELLSKSWQRKIFASFVLSFVLWWGNLVLVVWYITERLSMV